MTKVEALDRACEIWGTQSIAGVHRLDPPPANVAHVPPPIEWVVDLIDGSEHALDTNGHVRCRHPRCEALIS